MAKKQITAASSSAEVRTAYEQIAKAQQEYREALNALKNEQGIPVVPSTGQPLTAQQELNLAAGIASKYDYVDVGGNLGSKESGYNVGGDTFYVQGLSNQTKTTLPPESKTTINQDDAFPTSNTNTVAPKINTNPKTNNPSQAKLDQNVVNEAAPSPATQSSQVQPDTSTNTTSAKDSSQAGAALESNSKLQNTQNQNGIVSQNPNELPTTNNLPGRLSDEFLREPAISDSRKKGNIDDAAKNTNPMGTAITGFGNQNSINISPDPGISKPSGTVSIDTTDSVNVPQSAPGTNNKPGVTERPNILHEYANWTYKLAWYMLDNNSYNSIAKTGTIPGNVGRLIAKSGGVGAQQSQEMAGDVYFRNLPTQQHPEEGTTVKVVSTELYQSINPFWVVALTPVVVAFFLFMKRRKKELSTPSKIAWGLFISALSPLVMVIASAAASIKPLVSMAPVAATLEVVY